MLIVLAAGPVVVISRSSSAEHELNGATGRRSGAATVSATVRRSGSTVRQSGSTCDSLFDGFVPTVQSDYRTGLKLSERTLAPSDWTLAPSDWTLAPSDRTLAPSDRTLAPS